jgi:hypothetical protein
MTSGRSDVGADCLQQFRDDPGEPVVQLRQ